MDGGDYYEKRKVYILKQITVPFIGSIKYYCNQSDQFEGVTTDRNKSGCCAVQWLLSKYRRKTGWRAEWCGNHDDVETGRRNASMIFLYRLDKTQRRWKWNSLIWEKVNTLTATLM